jgi:ADP-ribose pyrophosphatase
MRKVVPDNTILIPDKAQRVFEGVIYDVYQWEQENFDDSVTTFEMLKRPDTVSVIGLVNDKVVVIDDEQPHRGSKLSFPGGRVDPEDPSTLSAAQREVAEETGYTFRQWKLVDVFQPQLKLEWFIYIYVAWDVAGQTDTHHDPGERITIKLQDFAAIKSLVNAEDGHLGEARKLFEQVTSTQDLQNLPEFQGQTVDR